MKKKGQRLRLKKVHESYKCIMILTKQNMQSNVTLSGEVRLNMQLFQKDAWVMNRLRSANASAILTNLIQSHYLTGTGKVLQLLCSRWTQHKQMKGDLCLHQAEIFIKELWKNYVHLAQLNGCLYPYPMLLLRAPLKTISREFFSINYVNYAEFKKKGEMPGLNSA